MENIQRIEELKEKIRSLLLDKILSPYEMIDLVFQSISVTLDEKEGRNEFSGPETENRELTEKEIVP